MNNQRVLLCNCGREIQHSKWWRNSGCTLSTCLGFCGSCKAMSLEGDAPVETLPLSGFQQKFHGCMYWDESCSLLRLSCRMVCVFFVFTQHIEELCSASAHPPLFTVFYFVDPILGNSATVPISNSISYNVRNNYCLFLFVAPFFLGSQIGPEWPVVAFRSPWPSPPVRCSSEASLVGRLGGDPFGEKSMVFPAFEQMISWGIIRPNMLGIILIQERRIPN